MQKKLLLSSIVVILFFSVFNWSCSKLDTTDIGSNTLPVVDNINTFADTLDIITEQGVFDPDTTIVYRSNYHALGKINNDPLFGTTTANIFLQLKPVFYPYYFGNAKDTISNILAPGTGFDSVVLCLSYKGFWGDNTVPVKLDVKEIVNNIGNNGLWDSVSQIRDINYVPVTGGIIGSATIDPTRLADTIKYANKKDYSVNTIRIKLDPGFASQLFIRDTLSSGNGSFKTDTLFRLFNNGFAVLASGSGNGIMYCSLTDPATRLEIHYRKKNGGAIDTTFSSFLINTGGLPLIPISATANNIVRNRPAAVSSPLPDDDIYLQTTPGTYANLKIPELSTLPNMIIHRAEIIIEQIPTNADYDAKFSAPHVLYLDIKDTGVVNKWKPVYYDLNPNVPYDPDNQSVFFPASGVDTLYYGGYRRDKTDQFGNPIKYYNFNITRYVQQIITKHTPNYTLRLYAPHILQYPQYSASVPYYNFLAAGRVRVGSGSNANYKMKLRIIYSKI